MTTADYGELLTAAVNARGLRPPAIVVPEECYATVNGVHLHHLDWGNPHLPHVVLLHGGGLTAHTWDMAALLLRDRYHLVALDFRGHGESDWNPDVTDDFVRSDMMVDDTVALLQQLGYGRFSLVGMSRGGIVAMGCAPHFAEELEAFVLVDIVPEIRGGSADGNGGSREPESFASFDEALEYAARDNTRSPVEYLRYIVFHSLRQRPDGVWAWKEDRRPRTVLPRDERREAARRHREAMWSALKGLRAPALLMRGAASKIVSEEDARRTVDAISGMRYVVVPDAGHSVQTNNPTRFAEVLDEFLGESLAPTSETRPTRPLPALNYDGGGQATDLAGGTRTAP